MKRHLITSFFLVLAIALYAIGAIVPGTFLLLLGGIAELVFWVRISKRGKSR